MCQTSKKQKAVVNAAALGELMDICLRVHRNYDRMGTLGENEIRFKARMFLHLQYACQYRVVHANSIAMTVFEDATDPFCARLPASAKTSTTKRTPNKTRQASQPQQSDNSTPTFCCWLCPRDDHYCNNRKFHPLVNGKYAPITEDTKEAILAKIESSPHSAALKAEEKKKVRRFWSQHSL